jgi:hypothetical protein
MPRSSASSLLARKRRAARASLLAPLGALALVAAGCSGAKDIEYSPTSVQSAFATEGVALYGPRQTVPDDPLTPVTRNRVTPARPLDSVLEAVRSAVVPADANPGGAPTVLRGGSMLVYVYPTAEGAQAKVRNFADLEGAQAILHTTDFGYAIRGNVAVDYRVYSTGDRIPGYLGRWQNVGKLNHNIVLQVLAALQRLT